MTDTDPRAHDVASAVADALTTIDRTLERFGDDQFPCDCTVDDRYPKRKGDWPTDDTVLGSNVGWTSSFWTGQLWLALELTGAERYAVAAGAQVATFTDRLARDIELNHHDLGFLYTLGCVAGWHSHPDAAVASEAEETALAAADLLMHRRYLESAGVIQAWGSMSDPTQAGRVIIDSLLNLPLLFWASGAPGRAHYAERAHRHALALRDTIIRDDDSTFHTYYFDTTTGEPLRGMTAQGASDSSTWARGQAWGIYGFALAHAFTGDETLLDASERCARYFLAHLPADKVAFWDLDFTDGSSEERDSSAAAIAVCGLLQLAGALGQRGDAYRDAASEILGSLIAHYATGGADDTDALLRHAVYAKPQGIGIDAGCIWGDYYYLEALMRVTRPDWVPYWTLRYTDERRFV